MQSEQRELRARVPARTATLVHRDGLGFLHPARAHPLSVRDRFTVLGEVLRDIEIGRVVRVYRTDTGSHHIYRVRHAFLPEHGGA